MMKKLYGLIALKTVRILIVLTAKASLLQNVKDLLVVLTSQLSGLLIVLQLKTFTQNQWLSVMGAIKRRGKFTLYFNPLV